MLPNDSWSTVPQVSQLLPPHNSPPADRLTAFDAGPVEVNDLSAGLRARIWGASWSSENGEIRLGDGTLIGDVAALDWLSITFDQAGRPFAAWHESGQVFIRWFDSSVGEVVTAQIASGDQPLCHLDERRDFLTDRSDVLLVYRRGQSVFMRQQRDRFLIEYATPLADVSGLSMQAFGMSVTGRMEIKVSTPKGASDARAAATSATGTAATARPPAGIGTGA